MWHVNICHPYFEIHSLSLTLDDRNILLCYINGPHVQLLYKQSDQLVVYALCAYSTFKAFASVATIQHLQMEYSNLQRQAASLKKSILDQGYLDEQFCQTEDLQDEASPNFTQEVVSLFFKDSTRLITNIEQAMEKNPRDFNRWDANMQQLKGSCSSIGASRMKNECTLFRNCCGDENAEGCMRSFQKLKREHGALRQKLESYFQLLRQAGPADTARGKKAVQLLAWLETSRAGDQQ
ncbi:hypothetical protein BS78_09G207100 [Paspalum vaginatum]|nr:hypothetical protein BS78_09G207100 [Paspalum vaginatum]KAJ1263712.1 hypothetical protein BS78_09G207100 [Paspalum vaginatum]